MDREGQVGSTNGRENTPLSMEDPTGRTFLVPLPLLFLSLFLTIPQMIKPVHQPYGLTAAPLILLLYPFAPDPL
jgi:hypothetical protein